MSEPDKLLEYVKEQIQENARALFTKDDDKESLSERIRRTIDIVAPEAVRTEAVFIEGNTASVLIKADKKYLLDLGWTEEDLAKLSVEPKIMIYKEEDDE